MAAVTFFSVFIVIFDQLAAAAVRPPSPPLGQMPKKIRQKFNFKNLGK